jgi:hypothetical protein
MNPNTIGGKRGERCDSHLRESRALTLDLSLLQQACDERGRRGKGNTFLGIAKSHAHSDHWFGQ